MKKTGGALAGWAATVSLFVGALSFLPAAAARAQSFEVLHAFEDPPRQPSTALVQGSDGAFYGATSQGSGCGVIYRVNADGSGFAKLHDFHSSLDSSGTSTATAGGCHPSALVSSDGVLYGTTSSGGAGDWGIVFRLNEDGSGFTKLHDFDPAGGFSPPSDVLVVSGGVLYGSTLGGGAFGYGVLYRLEGTGAGYAVLHAFEGPDGERPAGLVSAGSILYGTASEGGVSGHGVVFRVNQDGSGFAVLHQFAGPDGSGPSTAVVSSDTNVLYGATSCGGAFGGGVLFKVNQDGSGFATLHDFDAASVCHPKPVSIASGGVLYGSTLLGGAFGCGIAYKIGVDGSAFAALHTFDPVSGCLPGRLISSGGVLYGTAAGGGASGVGTAFKLNEDGSEFTTLHEFGVGGHRWPSGSLVATGGLLYGTVSMSHEYGGGAVFKLAEDGSGFAVLRESGGSEDLDYFYGGLVSAGGVLYGTTFEGGVFDAGVVYRLNEDGSAFAVLHSFEGYENGGMPFTAPVRSGDALYGTAGVVYGLKLDGSGYATLHKFDGTDGAYPQAPLVSSGGVLYGTTSSGGARGRGVVFRIREDGSEYTVLHDFGAEGKHPAGLVSSGGVLYGTTSEGGAFGKGVVFKSDEDGLGFAVLYEFDGPNGSAPFAPLLSSDGVLYGTTRTGGAHGYGVIFKLNEDGTGFTKLHDFDGDNGSCPDALVRGPDGALYGTTWNGGPAGGGIVFRVTESSLAVAGDRVELGTTALGTPSTPSQTYTVSGDNLTLNVVITAPAGVEISKSGPGGPYASTQTLTPSSGSLPPTTIDLRIAASAPHGPIAGDVVNASYGAFTRKVAVSGVVTDPVTPPTGVPTLLAPTGTVATRTPTFQWTPVLAATDYRLHVEKSSTVVVDSTITAAAAGCDTGTCSVVSPATLASGLHEWKVLPQNVVGTGTWSDAGTFTVQQATAGGARTDFDGDGKADVFWRHTSGANAVWLMDGLPIKTSGGLATVNTPWTLAGGGDLDGDGKTDVLWRNTSTGDNAGWLMSGTALAAGGLFPNVAPAWTVAGLGDFDGDAKEDILWSSGTGTFAVWFVNGLSVTSGALLPAVDAAWTASVADFDGSGKADVLLFRPSDGATAVWLMDGASVVGGGYVATVGAGWTPVLADIDGDGKADVIWRDAAGVTATWLMNGTTVAAGGFIGTVGPPWVLGGADDYDGDGKADFLWRNATDGNNAFWFMNGPQVWSSGLTTALGDLSWSIALP